ncbi:hypothetical protein [Mycolicibacterium sp. A43C]
MVFFVSGAASDSSAPACPDVSVGSVGPGSVPEGAVDPPVVGDVAGLVSEGDVSEEVDVDDPAAEDEPVPEDDADEEAEDVLDDGSPEESADAAGAHPTATPTPNVTANAPTRPMCAAYPMRVPSEAIPVHRTEFAARTCR